MPYDLDDSLSVDKVSIMFSQSWSCGKSLFMVIRYVTVISMALQLSSEGAHCLLEGYNFELGRLVTFRGLQELLFD